MGFEFSDDEKCSPKPPFIPRPYEEQRRKIEKEEGFEIARVAWHHYYDVWKFIGGSTAFYQYIAPLRKQMQTSVINQARNRVRSERKAPPKKDRKMFEIIPEDSIEVDE